ncbi:MAG: hypothetical protein ACK47B_17770 [Armatimonadota bacterium]
MITSNARELNAEREGVLAYSRGLAEAANPYSPEEPLHGLWVRGWRWARKLEVLADQLSSATPLNSTAWISGGVPRDRSRWS